MTVIMAKMTLEDIIDAARCVALWRKCGRNPISVARDIKGAAARAVAFRRAEGAVHPTLGDGSVAAVANSLAPCRGHLADALVTPADLLAALAAVSVVMGKGKEALKLPKRRTAPMK